MSDEGAGSGLEPAAASGNALLHGSFTVTRDIAAAPARVWAGYATPELRSAWRRLPGPGVLELDFRVGGWERLTGSSTAAGPVETIASHALFLDIVDGQRIVAAQEALIDGVRRWVSLISIGFEAAPAGTRVTHTEQYTFLVWSGDGAHDRAHLQGGTQLAFNGLAALLELPGGPPRRRGRQRELSTRPQPPGGVVNPG